MDKAGPDLAKFLANPKLKLTLLRRKPYSELIVALRARDNDLDKGVSLGAYFKKPNHDFQFLVRLRQSVEYRTVLEGFMVSSITPEEAVTLINERYGFRMTKESYQIYQAFFFDTSHLGADGWQYHLLTADPGEAKMKKEILQRPDDINLLKWKLGFQVKIEYTTVLQKIMNDANFKYDLEAAKLNPDKQALNIYSMIAMRAGDRQERYKPKGTADEAGMMQMRIQQVKAMNQQAAPIHVGPLPDLKPGKPVLVAMAGGRDKEKTKEGQDGQE